MAKFDDMYRLAKKKGYTVDPDGTVIGPTGKRLKPQKKRKYLAFGLWNGKRMIPLHIHRFHAYLLFGEDTFKPGIVVRHTPIDDKHCNCDNNLQLGTQQENMDDVPLDVRLKQQGYTWAVRRTADQEFEQKLAIGW